MKAQEFEDNELANTAVHPGGRVLLVIHGRGVLAGSPNPDPISDQKMQFSVSIFQPGP